MPDFKLEGKTPLHLAILNKDYQYQCIRALLDSGCGIAAKGCVFGSPILIHPLEGQANSELDEGLSYLVP